MQKDNISKSYLKLHLIVFIWGFTALLGKLISLQALPLVWYRMALATVFIGIYVVVSKKSMQLPWRSVLGLLFAGLIIALHWLTFFASIKASNISVTLACLSTGAFFTAILEPIFYKKKVVFYEVFLGLLVILGLYVIFQVDRQYVYGILLALCSAFSSALFSVINGKFAVKYNPSVISFYVIGGGFLFLSFYMLLSQEFTPQFFQLSARDLFWLFVLSSICTAYAFVASVDVMKYLSPYTVMLTINLEPIYGIILALIVFNDNEKMSNQFYIGALIILLTVLLNGVLKNRKP